jgi:hypothetical protein
MVNETSVPTLPRPPAQNFDRRTRVDLIEVPDLGFGRKRAPICRWQEFEQLPVRIPHEDRGSHVSFLNDDSTEFNHFVRRGLNVID